MSQCQSFISHLHLPHHFLTQSSSSAQPKPKCTSAKTFSQSGMALPSTKTPCLTYNAFKPWQIPPVLPVLGVFMTKGGSLPHGHGVLAVFSKTAWSILGNFWNISHHNCCHAVGTQRRILPWYLHTLVFGTALVPCPSLSGLQNTHHYLKIQYISSPNLLQVPHVLLLYSPSYHYFLKASRVRQQLQLLIISHWFMISCPTASPPYIPTSYLSILLIH